MARHVSMVSQILCCRAASVILSRLVMQKKTMEPGLSVEVRASDGLGAAGPAEPQNGNSTILRFRRSERLLHWAIAFPFMMCWLSAMILVHFYNPYSLDRAYRDVFSWIHGISAICLVVFPISVVLISRRDLTFYLDNIKQAWTWTSSDIKWLCLQGPATLNKEIKLPEQGKFNAGEKINFMAVTVACPLLIVTGILIWLPGVNLLAWFTHFYAGIGVTALMLGHIWMATCNPDTRPGLAGMISGYVDKLWAKHHYRAWYRENFEHGQDAVITDPALAIAQCPDETPAQEVTPLAAQAVATDEFPAGDGDSDGSHIAPQPLSDEEQKWLEGVSADELETVESGSLT
jgi:formate dehydrogenase subunit gamma